MPLTKSRKAEAADYLLHDRPECRNRVVPDSRLDPLAKSAGTTTIIPAAIEMVDIAGLVEGASRRRTGK